MKEAGRIYRAPFWFNHLVIDERLPVRFAKKFVVAESGCWQWTAYRSAKGYGQFLYDGRVGKAHRYVYEALVGPIPDGLEIDHLCKNRACVNPAHLEPVTHTENIRRRYSRTHCPHGHEFTAANTAYARNGTRVCKKCRYFYVRRWKLAQRATEL